MPSARVLLVEDEYLIKLILIETLEDAGFCVVSAGTADEAASLACEANGFDILITDIQTPGHLDGIDLARKLRVKHPALPILFTTGRPQAMARYGRLGPHEAFVPKPYGPHELLGAIERLLET